MPRRPPQTGPDRRGPRETKRLPDRSDARRTWTGPPTQRSAGRWSGAVDFDGKKHHVGTYDTPRQWGRARDKLIAELAATVRERRETPQAAGGTELAGVTVAEFVGPAGEGWPWDFTRNGKRTQGSTFRQAEQQVRAFVLQFGDRPVVNAMSRLEANRWANQATRGQLSAARAMFVDARSIDPAVVNALAGFNKTTRGRRDLPDVLSSEEVEQLIALARATDPVIYGPILACAIEVAATTGIRPGELFALQRSRLSIATSQIRIHWAVKDDGQLGDPKYGQRRDIILTPSVLDQITALPVLHEDLLFPTKRGKLMRQTNWTTYWHPLREAFTATLPAEHWLRQRIADAAAARAAEPDPKRARWMDDGKLDFYELRHRAITFLGTPKPHGLGVASADIAYLVGHLDGGALIEEVYMHRRAEHALDRIRRAMNADG